MVISNDHQHVLTDREASDVMTTLWRGIYIYCSKGEVQAVPDLVAKLQSCTSMTAGGMLRLNWRCVPYRKPVPFILRALLDVAQKVPISEVDLSDNDVGDEHGNLLLDYIRSARYLRIIELHNSRFSPVTVEGLLDASTRRDITIKGLSDQFKPQESSFHTRMSPAPKVNITENDIIKLTNEVEERVKNLGLSHRGQLVPERDRLLRRMQLENGTVKKQLDRINNLNTSLSPRRAATTTTGTSTMAMMTRDQTSGTELLEFPSPIPKENQNDNHNVNETLLSQDSGPQVSPFRTLSMTGQDVSFNQQGSFNIEEPTQTERSIDLSKVSRKSPMIIPSVKKESPNTSLLVDERDRKSREKQMSQHSMALPGDLTDILDTFDITSEIPNHRNTIIRDFSSMRLSSVSYKDLSKITVLILRDNPLVELSGLPDCVVCLDISNCGLKSLNGSLSNCTNLVSINARRNCLSKMSNCFTHNRLLRKVLLGRNKIRKIEGIEHLTELTFLDISDNQLATPASIRTLSLNIRLRTLVLKGNPLSHPAGRRRVCISNIPSSCDKVSVEALVRPYGCVEEVDILSNRTTRDGSRTAAFVTFKDAGDVAKSAAASISGQQPAPGVPNFEVEVRGKKGRVVIHNLLSTIDKQSLTTLLSMHGNVSEIEIQPPRWEYLPEGEDGTVNGWQQFSNEYMTRLDSAYARQGQCRVKEMLVTMTTMRGIREYDGLICKIRMHRIATAVFSDGTAAAERAKQECSTSPWDAGKNISLIVRQMPDYRPLIMNLLPNLEHLDEKYHATGVSLAYSKQHYSSLNKESTLYSHSQLEDSSQAVSGLDISTSVAHKTLSGVSFESAKQITSPGYSSRGRAKATARRIQADQIKRDLSDKQARKFGLQPSQQGEIITKNGPHGRSKSATSLYSHIKSKVDSRVSNNSRMSRSSVGTLPLNDSDLSYNQKRQLLDTITISDTDESTNATLSRDNSIHSVQRFVSKTLVPSDCRRVKSTKTNQANRGSLQRSKSAPVDPTRGRRHHREELLDNYEPINQQQLELKPALRDRSFSKGRDRGVSFSSDVATDYSNYTENDVEPELSVGGDVQSQKQQLRPPTHPSSVRTASPRLREALNGIEAFTTPQKNKKHQLISPRSLQSPQVSDALQVLFDQLSNLHQELSAGRQESLPTNIPFPSMTPKGKSPVASVRKESPVVRGPPDSVISWLSLLKEDYGKAQLAVKALLVLIAKAPKSEQERYKLIVKSAKLLNNTQVPSSVVQYFNITEEDLAAPAISDPTTPLESLLQMLKHLSDTKTCLKYIFALIDQGNTSALDEYAKKVTKSPIITRSVSSFPFL